MRSRALSSAIAATTRSIVSAAEAYCAANVPSSNSGLSRGEPTDSQRVHRLEPNDYDVLGGASSSAASSRSQRARAASTTLGSGVRETPKTGSVLLATKQPRPLDRLSERFSPVYRTRDPSLWQTDRAADRLRRGSRVRLKASRFHHAVQRRGGRVATGGARAAIGAGAQGRRAGACRRRHAAV